MNDIHWSFGYFYDADRTDITPIHVMQKPAFLQILRTYRQEAYPVRLQRGASWSAEYATVFNWSPAYTTSSDGVSLPELRAGELSVKKTAASGRLVRYSVNFEDSTSGEEGSADFTCTSDPLRELTGSWRLSIRNTADGTYDDYDLRGRIVSHANGEREIELSLCGSDYVTAGRIRRGIPCSSFWALYDAEVFLDAGQPLRGGKTMALLEGMEFLRPVNAVGYLEDFPLQIDGYTVCLRGYYVHGTGVVPRYYWLDDRGHVAIVSSIYTTWVLQRVAVQ